MNADDLLRLALRAIDDRTVRPVLGDAVLESNWADHRVAHLLTVPTWTRSGSGERPHAWRVRSLSRAWNLSRKSARNPTKRWCRAVAAVLLFAQWDVQRWPGTDSSWTEPPTWDEILRSYYPEERVTRAAYDESPLLRMLPRTGPGTFLGVNREASPARLTSQTITIADAYDVKRFVPGIVTLGPWPPKPLPETATVASLDRASGALAEAWRREMEVQMRGAVRVYSRAVYGGLPAPRDLRVNRRRG